MSVSTPDLRYRFVKVQAPCCDPLAEAGMAAAPASCHWGLTALIARRSCGRHRRSEQRSVESIKRCAGAPVERQEAACLARCRSCHIGPFHDNDINTAATEETAGAGGDHAAPALMSLNRFLPNGSLSSVGRQSPGASFRRADHRDDRAHGRASRDRPSRR
jgi:hypothetical protein